MPIFRSAHYNGKAVTAMTLDSNSGQYLWIAFEKDNAGNCRLLKVSAQDISQIYFDINVPVNAIKKMLVNGTGIFLGVDDPIHYIYRYGVGNPLVAPTITALPSGVNEVPVDVVDDGSGNFWWLFPGESGEIAQIVNTDNNGSFQQTITLTQSGIEVHHARSLTFRDGDLWVVTYEDPVNLYRVFLQSGGWLIQQTSLT